MPWLCVLLCVSLVLLAGCGRDDEKSVPTLPAAQPPPSVALRVLAVNDPPLAGAIERLRGEWSARSGGQLESISKPWSEVESADALDADVVIFPTRYLGTLCERGWLRPVRESVLRGKTYDAADVLPLVRRRLVRYGGQEMALPLGVEVPLVGYRQDWLAERQDETPRSWDEFQKLLQQPDVVPLWWPRRAGTAHWEATMLLARAAGYAVHPNREGVLFDVHTMKPRIAEPPFVRALEEWCGEKDRHGMAGVERSDPPAGQPAGGSPSARPQPPGAESPVAAVEIVWAGLPGSAELYNHLAGDWETAEHGVRQVPLVGGGGSLAGVTASSRNAASAFRLAAWLTGAEIGGQIGPKAAASLPCRYSQMRAVGRWFRPPLPLGEDRVAAGDSPWRGEGALSNDKAVADAVERALSGETCLVVPPLPGVDRYLAALDEGVARALRGEQSAADALAEVAQEWDKLTDELGRDRQRQAYLKHLGIVEP